MESKLEKSPPYLITDGQFQEIPVGKVGAQGPGLFWGNLPENFIRVWKLSPRSFRGRPPKRSWPAGGAGEAQLEIQAHREGKSPHRIVAVLGDGFQLIKKMSVKEVFHAKEEKSPFASKFLAEPHVNQAKKVIRPLVHQMLLHQLTPDATHPTAGVLEPQSEQGIHFGKISNRKIVDTAG